jgi:hypothetical protein
LSQQPITSRRKHYFGWRSLAVFLLSLVGILALHSFVGVHWTERQLLTTDNWVTMVTPLPKNSTVAAALSNYGVQTVFTNINIERKVADALPPRAGFLAPVIAQQVQARTITRTTQFIQSDQFQGIWVLANRAASQQLLNVARSSPNQARADRIAKFNLKISALKNQINSVFGNMPSTSAAAASNNQQTALSVNLKTRVNRLRTFVKTTDFLNSVLGPLALSCLLGAIVLSMKRRRLLLSLSAIIFVLALIELVSIKAARQAVLNSVQTTSYRAAVGIVYDTVAASFRRSTELLAVIAVVIYALCLFSRSIAAWLSPFKSTQVWQWVRRIRQLARQYILQLVAAVLVIGLLLMAFTFNLSWQGIIRSVLQIIVAAEAVCLFATRSYAGRPRSDAQPAKR